MAIFYSIEIVGKRELKHLHFNKPSAGKSNWKKKVKDQGWLIKQTHSEKQSFSSTFSELHLCFLSLLQKKVDFYISLWSHSDLCWLSSMLLLSGTPCMISINPLIIKVTFAFSLGLFTPLHDYSWEHRHWKDVDKEITKSLSVLLLALFSDIWRAIRVERVKLWTTDF